MLLIPVLNAEAGVNVSVGVSLPGISIGVNMPMYPELVRVPGYPVYYAPQIAANYFFYDGMYWVYDNDYWYASSWYNGPWEIVQPEFVPLFILRIPVRYYRQPPVYFRSWQPNAPPRWGQHWGHEWERNRSGWDRWNRSSAPAPAPLPVYQRQYTGERYPSVEQQPSLRNRNYRYQPREKVIRQHYRQTGEEKAPARQGAPAYKDPQPQKERGGQQFERPVPDSPASRQQPPVVREQYQQSGNVYKQQREPAIRGQEQGHRDRGSLNQPSPEREHGSDKNEERGRGRNN
jgi:hypothetical protein